jgi:hypothetical protein
MWLIETDVVAGAEHPLLTLVSPAFLRQRTWLIESLRQAGFDDLVVTMVQQIVQFHRRGAEFALHHRGTEVMMPVLDILRDILRDLPPEERRRLLDDLPIQERLADVPAEQRLLGLSLEERLAGLSPEQLAKLRELLPPPPSD